MKPTAYWLLFLLGIGLRSWGHGTGENRLAQLHVRLAARPELVEDRLERAVLLIANQQFERALFEIQITRELAPTHHGGLLLESRVLEAVGHLEPSLFVLEKYLAIYPQSAQALEMQAKLLVRLKRDAEALHCLDCLCQVVPHPQPDLLLQRLRLAERLYGPTSALAWVEQRMTVAALPILKQEAQRLAEQQSLLSKKP